MSEVVDLNGCVVVSECDSIMDVNGVGELGINDESELIKIVDLMGRATQENPNTVLIYMYSDGTNKRIFRIDQ